MLKDRSARGAGCTAPRCSRSGATCLRSHISGCCGRCFGSTASAARTAPPASWKTSDGTLLLQLVLLSLQTGRGEEQLDSNGYTLRQWEEYYEKNGTRAEANWMAGRAQAVRQSWQQRYLARQSG